MTEASRDAGLRLVLRLVVQPQHSRLRLDQYLAAASELSRRKARRLIGEGQVRVDGQPVKVQSREVRTAQVVEVTPDPRLAPAPERAAERASERSSEPASRPFIDRPIDRASDRVVDGAIDIVYEDDALLVVNKPAGVLSQPLDTPRADDLAMDQLVRLHLAERDGRRPPYLALIHRLDRVASGLLVFALQQEAAGPLSEAFRRRQTERRAERWYLAVVDGEPDFEEIHVDRPIARARGFDWKFETTIPGDPDGKPAQTDVVVEAVGEGWARVRCRLGTGRTHQVRVHLADLGHPVRGDGLYGSFEAPRALLHAVDLELPHPVTGERLQLHAPPPADFEPYLGT